MGKRVGGFRNDVSENLYLLGRERIVVSVAGIGAAGGEVLKKLKCSRENERWRIL